MSEEDEFDSYGFIDFTAEELASINEALESLERTTTTVQSQGAPAVEIELEVPADDSALEVPTETGETAGTSLNQLNQISPLREYRSSGILSVTDIVSPAWCELQFDYGLRQKRSWRPERRPSSFTTAEGKTITVEKAVAEQNFETTSRGKSVHKALEREVKPVTTYVPVKTEEERWALRLVNMMFCFDNLISMGHTREMPVFGIIHGHIVVGIIDELHRKFLSPPSSSTAQANLGSKKRGADVSADQAQITSFFSAGGGDTPLTIPLSESPIDPVPSNASNGYTLRLLDNKTRRSPSLPSHEDTVSSRLQVMLYHRLLNDLLCGSCPFDFPSLWKRLNLDPSRRFGDEFLVQAGLIPDDDHIPLPNCLTTLVADWRHAANNLSLASVSPSLQLVYRTQPSKTSKQCQKRRKLQSQPTIVLEEPGQEDRELALAIQASLDDLLKTDVVNKPQPQGLPSLQPLPVTEDEGVASANVASTPESSVVDEIQLLQVNTPSRHEDPTRLSSTTPPKRKLTEGQEQNNLPPSTAEPLSTSESDGTSAQESRIIGTKEFELDEPLLDAYVSEVLEWWSGERRANGVPIENARRCFSCEYSGGCEWREAKAKEFERAVNARNGNV
ncbi:hypothetical protein HGRIS_008344 [Hohenbuehelia grisea]|uniref:Exonuclease V n=1 Tax=Hohenbuehelia grisea TaxID=104357 RepID=A0ABR3J7N5_9AGAR